MVHVGRVRVFFLSAVFTLLALLAAGCTGMVDGGPDTGPVPRDDARVPVDASPPGDAALMDGGSSDGGPSDGAPVDSAATDSGIAPADGAVDSGLVRDGTVPMDATPPRDGSVPSTGAVQIATGGYHSCARMVDDTLRCWGRNNARQTVITAGNQLTPVEVVAAGAVSQVSLGYEFSCVLDAAGVQSCWGANTAGQLGAGVTGIERTPVVFGESPLTALPLRTQGHWHGCGLTATGAAYCAGWNNRGQLGRGDFDEVPHPDTVAVGGLPAAVQLTAGYFHTCARHADGTAHCWGLNGAGQLGTGSPLPDQEPTPQRVLGVDFIAWIVAASVHTCAVDGAGDVWCWGGNGSGQLADGTRFSRRTPTRVSGPTGVVQIAASSGHTCAVGGTGALWCWGRNTYGQVGIGTVTDRELVAHEIAITNVAEVAAGERHTCVRRRDGEVWCWGANDGGQVGDGTTMDRSSPVRAGL